MEDDQNGRQPTLKTTKLEDNQNIKYSNNYLITNLTLILIISSDPINIYLHLLSFPN